VLIMDSNPDSAPPAILDPATGTEFYTQIVTFSTDNILKTTSFRDSVARAVRPPVRRWPSRGL